MNDSRRRYLYVQDAFSFIELVIVIAIIGLLMAIAIPMYQTVINNARVTKAEAEIRNLKTAIMQYNLHTSRYPQALSDLTRRPTDEAVSKKWKGPYFEEVPEDPWGETYVYRVTPGGQKYPYELYSNGPKGAEASAEERIGQWN